MHLRNIRALRRRSERERTGLCLVGGTAVVAAAFRARAQFELVLAAPERLRTPFALELLARARAANLPVLELSAPRFEALFDDDGRIGLAAVVQQRWVRLAEVAPTRRDCWVVLDAVQYAGNIGAIMRTAEAVRAAGLILVGDGADPYDPAAVRASRGAVFRLRVVRASFVELEAWARRHGVRIVGSSPAAGLDYRRATYVRPLALLLGSERVGLSAAQQARCDQVVRIPMQGRGDSLNVAVAASLLLYEAVRADRDMYRRVR
jgi:TrmH family RNA methyltransferase